METKPKDTNINKSQWITSVEFAHHDWVSIESILDRALTGAERSRIMFDISSFATMRSLGTPHIKTQAIKCELESFEKLPDAAVLEALQRANKNTRTEIESALVKMRLSFKGHSPGLYKSAALSALKAMPKGKSGNSKIEGYRLAFARGIIEIWKYLGRKDMEAWEFDGKTTPLVEFASALLEVIELDNAPSLSVIAKIVRKANKVIA